MHVCRQPDTGQGPAPLEQLFGVKHRDSDSGSDSGGDSGDSDEEQVGDRGAVVVVMVRQPI